MPNPQLHSYGHLLGVDADTADVAVPMPPSWGAGMLILLFVGSDGFEVELAQANGFVAAIDSQGNVAKSIIPGVTGIHVFWKRAIGGDADGLDPSPVVRAPTSVGGSVIAAHTNSYTGCRAAGTPFHRILTSIATPAPSNGSATPPPLTTSIPGCSVIGIASSENNETNFHGWGGTGAADPDAGFNLWFHSGRGNACSFAGGIGGRSTPGTVALNYFFDLNTRQGLVSLALASQDEPPISAAIDNQLEGSAGSSQSTIAILGSHAAQLEGTTETASAAVAASASVATSASGAATSIITTIPATGAIDDRLEDTGASASAAALVSGSIASALEGSQEAATAGSAAFVYVDSIDEGSNPAATATIRSLVPPKRPRGTRGTVRRRL